MKWFFLFQWAFAATVAAIVSGGVAERIHLLPHMGCVIITTALVYPLVVYWTSASKGWLSGDVPAAAPAVTSAEAEAPHEPASIFPGAAPPEPPGSAQSWAPRRGRGQRMPARCATVECDRFRCQSTRWCCRSCCSQLGGHTGYCEAKVARIWAAMASPGSASPAGGASGSAAAVANLSAQLEGQPEVEPR